MSRKVSEIIASFFVHHGIDTAFGIIGSANSHIYDSFKKNDIRIINVHQEQCAVIAAGAFYKATGKMAVAIVTAGGGATNSVTGIVSLWADSTPTIILSGQESSGYVSSQSHRRMWGTQGFDFPHMVSKTTKYAKTIVDFHAVQVELETAFYLAMGGRKGPVVLDFPFDVQSQSAPFRDWISSVERYHIESPPSPLIGDLIRAAKRPVFLAGNGVKLSKSVDIFKQLLEKIRIPVLLTWSGIDILPDDHPLYFGRPGLYGQRCANFVLQKSDLLIVLGSRLTIPQTGYDLQEFARRAKIVMVDVDSTERKEFVDHFIEADCADFIKNMLDHENTIVNCNENKSKNAAQLEEQEEEQEQEQWLNECRELSQQFPTIDDRHHADDIYPNSYKIMDKISDFLKPDQIIVTDMGTALLSGHQSIRLQKDHIMFSSYGLGEMGYGLPAALGAAISSPQREVLCLNCDGGMMMNLQELQTIVQHNLKVKIVIFNNDGYLMIKHTQKMLFNNNNNKGSSATANSVDSKSGIVLPDYMKVADAFGYTKYQIKTWQEFYSVFPVFMGFNSGPCICEIFMPPDQEFIPKVKGVLSSDSTIFAPPLEEMSPLLSYDVVRKIMGGENVSIKSEKIVRN
jgi:acetolactate synthase-1/2/3 large subunit